MKNTALTSIHKNLGARMLPFAGYSMPIEYSGIKDEHFTVRNNVGAFDVSHMGCFWVSGPNAFSLLQSVTTNDLLEILPGKAQYTCFPNGRGGIVDDLIVYQYDKQKYFLIVNASNIEKDWDWLNQQNIAHAVIENPSEDMSIIALQGPEAVKTLQKLTTENVSNWDSFTFKVMSFKGVKDVIVSSTGYTGAGGFELYLNNKYALKMWNMLFEAGHEFGIKPIGLAARDTLRLEMGYSLYGNDIDDTTSPIEASLGWITKFNEKNNFIDKEYLLNQKVNGVSRKLVAFEMLEKAIPRHNYIIVNNDNKEIGKVTSGTMSPSLSKGIGMGYVSTSYSKLGQEIFISIRNKNIKAKVVKLPFYK